MLMQQLQRNQVHLCFLPWESMWKGCHISQRSRDKRCSFSRQACKILHEDHGCSSSSTSLRNSSTSLILRTYYLFSHVKMGNSRFRSSFFQPCLAIIRVLEALQVVGWTQGVHRPRTKNVAVVVIVTLGSHCNVHCDCQSSVE